MDNNSSSFETTSERIARRKRQFWVQILLPVLVAVLIVGVLGVLSTRAANPQISLWGNVSTILVSLPVLLTCLVALVILAAMIYGTARLTRALPRLLLAVQMRIYQVEIAIRRAADQAAAPVIKTRSTTHGLRSLFKRSRNPQS